MGKLILTLIFLTSVSLCSADDGNTEKAIGTTTKVFRSTKLGREIEKRTIRKGHDIIREYVPYSETLIGSVALVLQPVQYSINKYNRVVYDFKRQKIEYQFNYEF